VSEPYWETAAAYAEGVNAYLSRRGKDLPLEFRSMGFEPEPWKPEDTASTLPYLSWELAFSPYAAKLFAVARGSSLSLGEWDDLFAGYPDARLPPDAFFDSLARLKFGALLPTGARLPHGIVRQTRIDGLRQ
jgi:hypothetical protein